MTRPVGIALAVIVGAILGAMLDRAVAAQQTGITRTVLQRVEDLTDRRAAEAVRTDLSWKYALGLELDDPGFDASVLSEFRSRVIAHVSAYGPMCRVRYR